MLQKAALTIFFFLFFKLTFPSTSYAQSLKMEILNKGLINVGDTLKLQILIDTTGQPVISGDALLQFDPKYLKPLSSTNNGFFSNFFGTLVGLSQNKYLLSGWQTSIASPKKSSGPTPLATIGFQILKSGITELVLICQNNMENDSNINDARNSNDILDCQKLTPLTIEISSQGQNNPPNTDDLLVKILELIRKFIDKISDTTNRFDRILSKILVISDKYNKNKNKDPETVKKISLAEVKSKIVNKKISDLNIIISDLKKERDFLIFKTEVRRQITNLISIKSDLQEYQQLLRDLIRLLRKNYGKN